MAMFYALLTLYLSGYALAQMEQQGPCPDVEVMPDFDISKFIGRWYWYQFLVVPNEETPYKCLTADYSLDENGTVEEIQTFISRREGWKMSVLSIYHVPDPAVPAKFIYETSGTDEEVDEWILATDYESYALTYTCDNVGPDHHVVASVLSREPNPPTSLSEEVGEIIEKHNLEKWGFRMMKQGNCVMKPDEDYED